MCLNQYIKLINRQLLLMIQSITIRFHCSSAQASFTYRQCNRSQVTQVIMKNLSVELTLKINSLACSNQTKNTQFIFLTMCWDKCFLFLSKLLATVSFMVNVLTRSVVKMAQLSPSWSDHINRQLFNYPSQLTQCSKVGLERQTIIVNTCQPRRHAWGWKLVLIHCKYSMF